MEKNLLNLLNLSPACGSFGRTRPNDFTGLIQLSVQMYPTPVILEVFTKLT